MFTNNYLSAYKSRKILKINYNVTSAKAVCNWTLWLLGSRLPLPLVNRNLKPPRARPRIPFVCSVPRAPARPVAPLSSLSLCAWC